MLTHGALFADDRGFLKAVNDFDMSKIKRFYIVENNQANFVRAWHGHIYEAKYVIVIQGSAVIGLVKIDNWDNPSKYLDVERHILSANSPCILHIPPGYVNGSMNLTEDTILMYFSTATLDDSKDDDYRYPARYWDCWSVEER